MTDTPWTPGPWEVGRNEIGPQWVVWWSNYNNDPANVRFLAETSREADARLIAAAPEMAEMLEALTDQGAWPGSNEYEAEIDRAKALLSRIREETEPAQGRKDPAAPHP